jgi:hypothetical protein
LFKACSLIALSPIYQIISLSNCYQLKLRTTKI